MPVESAEARVTKRAGRDLRATSVRFDNKVVRDCLFTAVTTCVEGRRFRNICRGGETVELITL